MSRTSKLMTTVLASILLNGGVPRTVVVAEADQKLEADQSETDTEVAIAAARIREWLQTTKRADAKSLEEIIREFPQFNSALVEQALIQLIDARRINRMGDGSNENPYRYYTPDSYGG